VVHHIIEENLVLALMVRRYLQILTLYSLVRHTDICVGLVEDSDIAKIATSDDESLARSMLPGDQVGRLRVVDATELVRNDRVDRERGLFWVVGLDLLIVAVVVEEHDLTHVRTDCNPSIWQPGVAREGRGDFGFFFGDMIMRDLELLVVKLEKLEEIPACDKNVIGVTVADGDLEQPQHILVLRRHHRAVTGCQRSLLVPLPQNNLQVPRQSRKKFLINAAEGSGDKLSSIKVS